MRIAKIFQVPGLLILSMLSVTIAGQAQAAEECHDCQFSIGTLIAAVLSNNPGLKVRRLEALASEQDTKAAGRLKWGSVSVSSETNTSKVNSGSYPARMLRLDQNIWDNGWANAKEQEARAQQELAFLQIDAVAQELGLQTVQTWQALMAANGKIAAAQIALKRLREYRQQMQRRVDAQAASAVDLELTQARVLQTEVELAAVQSTYRLAIQKLESLLGEQGVASRMPTHAMGASESAQRAMTQWLLSSTDWQGVIAKHPALLRSQQEITSVTHKLAAKKAEQWPQVYVRLDQPLSQTINVSSTATSYYLGIRYSSGAGFMGQVEAQAMSTRLQSAQQAQEAVRQELIQQLNADKEEFINSRERITAMAQTVRGAEVVLESYMRQFQAGRKNWMDLLNVQRELVQNQFALAETQASLLGALLRLQIRTGQNIQAD